MLYLVRMISLKNQQISGVFALSTQFLSETIPFDISGASRHAEGKFTNFKQLCETTCIFVVFEISAPLYMEEIFKEVVILFFYEYFKIVVLIK